MSRRPSRKLRIIIRTLFRVALRLIADPRLFTASVRAMYAAERNFDFEQSSPLPLLPRHILDEIQAREVVLPPGKMIQDGNQSLDGLAFLSGLTRALNASTAFEIGTYNGVTAWCLSHNHPKLVVHTLDIPLGSAPALPLAHDDALNLGHQEQPKMYESLPTNGTVVQHWGDSATFDFTEWRGLCDLVYIDGAHSPAYVANDTRIAFDLISRRAAIVWDDYWPMVPGVPAILDQLPHINMYRVPRTRLVIYLTEEAFKHLVSTPD